MISCESGSDRIEAQPQRLHPAQDVACGELEGVVGIGEAQVRQAGQHDRQSGCHLQPRQVHPEAGVHSGSESDVFADIGAGDIELVGIGEFRRVAIGRAVAQQQRFAGLECHPAEHGILKGITRTTLMDVAAKLCMTIREEAFSVEKMLGAREVFITAATSICFPIVEIDGQAIANGHPGAMSERIRSAFFDVAEKTVI